MPKSFFSVEASTSLDSLPAKPVIHVIGVCGVAMAQMAVALSKRGAIVSGSDKEFYEPMGSLLRQSSVTLFQGYNALNVPSNPDLVVIGNAISYGHPEVEEIEKRNLPYTFFPKILFELVIKGHHSMVVSGTHGKSTTSALLTTILHRLELDPAYFIGAVVKDLPLSLSPGSGPCSVVEGDEYDSAFFAKRPKFSFYQPDTLIITSVEYDHADIYPDLETINRQFDGLVRSMKGGRVICCVDEPNLRGMCESWKLDQAAGKVKPVILRYGNHESADFRLLSTTQLGKLQEVVLQMKDGTKFSFQLSLGGTYNALNAIACLIACEVTGLSQDQISQVLSSFQGVRRRQDVRLEAGGITLIEDFAHHPTAVRETLLGLRRVYAERRIWAVFEPRSNTSRRKVFQQDYLHAFGPADRVILAEVEVRAIDKGEELIDVRELSDRILGTGKSSLSFSDTKEIANHLLHEVKTGDVIVVMSNGSFGGLIQILEKGLADRVCV